MAKATKALTKVTPYTYPSTLHVRSETPKRYRQYGSFKPTLHKEFGSRCVYCRSPLSMGGKGVSVVEHFKPKSIYPALQTEYENLFLACPRCNSFKGTHWSSDIDRTLLNPCDDVMSTHIKFSGSCVSFSSQRGHFHIELLRLNDTDRTADREVVRTMALLGIEKLLTLKSKKKQGSEYEAASEKVISGLCRLLAVERGRFLRVIGW